MSWRQDWIVKAEELHGTAARGHVMWSHVTPISEAEKETCMVWELRFS